MRADLQRATSPHIWLVAIGQQLRNEYTDIAEPPEPLPEHLATRLERLEAGETQPEPAAVRLAIINAVVRASAARGSRAAVSSVHEEWCEPRTPGFATPSRQATTLGKFEKLVLDLFDNCLSERERTPAVKQFAAYIRVCHAMLDLGLIKESELAV